MKSVVTLLLILLTVTLVYSNHFENSFHFDDFHTIQENPYILHLENIPRFYWDKTTFSSMPSHQGYRPLVTTTLAIDYALGKKLEPFFFHITNFTCFLVVILCTYFVLRTILTQVRSSSHNESFALFGAGLYGLHTANAETVNYIISRSDILSAVCHMLTFTLYLIGGRCRSYFLYIIPAAIGMFAKESSIMVAPVFVAYLYLIECDRSLPDVFTRNGIRTFCNCVLRALPLILICFVLAVISVKMASTFVPGGPSRLLYAMTQPYVMMLYVKTFFLPTHLSADTDIALVSGLGDPRFWSGLVFLLLLVSVAVFTSQKKEGRPIAFGIAWFLLVLLPTSSVIPLAEVLNDHRTFLPFVGLSIALVTSLANISARTHFLGITSEKLRYPALLLGAFTLLGMGYGTRQRNIVWKSEESLWRDVTEKSPRNGRGWMNYGLTQMGKGKYSEADVAFQKGLKFTPFYSSLHINLGILRNATGQKKEAEQFFRNALAYASGEIEPYYFFAAFLRQEKRYTEARVLVQKALTMFPAHLASLHEAIEIGQSERSSEAVRKAVEETLRQHPRDKKALEIQRQLNGGTLSWPEESKTPTAAQYVDESLAFYSSGDYESAITAAKNALRVQADYPEAFNNICASLIQLRRYDEAIAECQRAIALRPDFALAKNNLRWAETEKAK